LAELLLASIQSHAGRAVEALADLAGLVAVFPADHALAGVEDDAVGAVDPGPAPPDKPEKKDGWAQRVLAEPRLGLAMLVGALVGIPGASYLTALHDLVTGKSPTATQVIAVVIFVIIDFMLIIIPFGFLELRPAATKAALKHAQDWLMKHALRLMATIALLLGAYLAVSGLVRLS
jgi:Sap, sulfolipid-1-addressing protein